MLSLLLVAAAYVPASAAQSSRESIPAPPQLTITAPPELSAAAARIARYDVTRLGNVMRLVGLTDEGPVIRVVLEPEDSDLGRQTPRWIAGFADSRAGVIVLFPARTPTYPYDSMEELLHHEVAHILIARAAAGAMVPRWFHEGLAMAAERTWRLADHRRLVVAVLGTRPSIAELDAEFDGGPDRAARAYGVSGAFVSDLLRRHGAALPARILRRLASGDPFEQAFLASAGTPFAEAERMFWRYSWFNQL
ncbi:MAG: peptidase MA family metallohydrolase, partial [Vicinamibacterales bacterium]